MQKSIHQLTTNKSSRIYKDPIQLPCGDSICRQHLSERDVVKEKRIKCKECKHEFTINDYEFKSNEALKNLIERQSYLSEEEISRKQKMEDSIRKFFEYYDEFSQNKNKS